MQWKIFDARKLFKAKEDIWSNGRYLKQCKIFEAIEDIWSNGRYLKQWKTVLFYSII